MPFSKAIIATAAFLLLATSALGDEEELKRHQGRFERNFTNAAGAAFRSVREVVGNQSTVKTFDDMGNLLDAHVSTIKAEKQGQVHVLSFFNLLITAGPNKGHTDPATRSYIYRIDGDNFAEAWGLLEGDSSPPRILIWRKMKGE
jgi:hypothetical protein